MVAGAGSVTGLQTGPGKGTGAGTVQGQTVYQVAAMAPGRRLESEAARAPAAMMALLLAAAGTARGSAWRRLAALLLDAGTGPGPCMLAAEVTRPATAIGGGKMKHKSGVLLAAVTGWDVLIEYPVRRDGGGRGRVARCTHAALPGRWVGRFRSRWAMFGLPALVRYSTLWQAIEAGNALIAATPDKPGGGA